MHEYSIFTRLNRVAESTSGFVCSKIVKIALRYKNHITTVLAVAPVLGLVTNEYFVYLRHGERMFSKPHDFFQLAASIVVGFSPAYVLNKLLKMLEDEKQLIDNIIETVPGGVLYRDRNGNYAFINQEARRIFEIAKDADIRGINLADILSDELLRLTLESDQHALGIKATVTDYMTIRGRSYIVRRSPQYDGQGEYDGMSISINDIDELHRLGFIDGLTGVSNKRTFDSDLEKVRLSTHRRNHIKSDSTRAALLYLDYDRFKSINDTFWHPVGDALLKTIASVLAHKARASDFVARIWGEEFGVIIQDVNSVEDAVSAANHYIDALRATPVEGITKESRDATGMSIGICIFTGEESTDEIRSRADKALYEAKKLYSEQIRQGTYQQGNVVVYSK